MPCKRPLFATIFAFLVLLTACAPKKLTHELPDSPTINPTQAEPKSIEPQHEASTLTHWEITGAMAARNDKKGWTANFDWIQRGVNEYQIRLFGPLGGGTVLIDREHGLTTYRDGAHRSSSADANQLLKQKTGVALPVANLYYWARGLPAPGPISAVKYDALKHITSFQQAGYTVEYRSTMKVNGIDLPKQIKLQGKGILIKVAIKQWKI